MSRRSSRALAELERAKHSYGPGSGGRKRELLEALASTPLDNASQVHRLHEVLCFLRAYPDDPALLAAVEDSLESFDRRRDLRRHRRELDSSGVVGTRISYRFFWFTALWLASRWPDLFHIDWAEFDKRELLGTRLPVLMSFSESLALEETWMTPREWIERIRGPEETDAAFLVGRFLRSEMSPFWRELVFEELDVPCYLEPGPNTPSRSRDRHRPAPVVYQTGPLEASRDAFPGALRRRPKRVTPVAPGEAQKLIDLARAAMVSRARDLDVFVHADRRDVQLMDCGRGLQFVCYGVTPERRQMLDAVYGFLILKNGIPMGYFLASALFRSALVAYNIFDTYRGAEAAYVYGRGLAMVRHVLRADTFGIETYQLGDGNSEALESGAWWFYYKLGFRPRDPEVSAIVLDELVKLEKDPRYRSSIATLRELAAVEMYLHLRKERDDIVGLIARENIGLRISSYLAERFGSDRERGIRVCAREAAKLLGVRTRRGFSAGERTAWNRWAPLVMILPGVERWTAKSKSALIQVIRAKGGARESDFVALFDRHRPLRRAVLKLAEIEPATG